jgi:hypothetical protein
MSNIALAIWPTSCRCGGAEAWYAMLPSNAWVSLGCICHNTYEQALEIAKNYLQERT